MKPKNSIDKKQFPYCCLNLSTRKCEMITDLEPSYIFTIDRNPSSGSQGSVLHLKQENCTKPPPLTLEQHGQNINSSLVSKLYLMIRSQGLEGSLNSSELLKNDIRGLNHQEKELLFSLLKRKKTGISQTTEYYSKKGIMGLSKMKTKSKKCNQDYRKLIIMDFYKYRLKIFQSENIAFKKTITCFTKNKKQFIEYYFQDYISQLDNQETLESLTDIVFGYYKCRRKGIHKKGIKGIWNLHYLKDILPKSDSLKLDLLKYTKDIFLKKKIEKYESEIQRFIKVLAASYNEAVLIDRDNELLLLQQKVQTSRKFKYPWELINYFEAKEYFCEVLEEKLYLNWGRGEYKKKSR